MSSGNSVETPPSRPTAGEWLTRQMNNKGMSVRQLANELGVTGKTVYDWRDNRTAISEARIPKIAEELGVSEIEARRGLGYWVPQDGDDEPPASNADELDELVADLTAVLERIRRLRRRD